MSKAPPPEGYDDNPEWTEEDFAESQPADAILAPRTVAALTRKPMGRPPGSNKQQVTLRLDNEVVAHFRAAGEGWQTRVNEALRKVAGL